MVFGDGRSISLGRKLVSGAPHLREESHIGPHAPGLPAGKEALFQVSFQCASGQKLKQCNDKFHGLFLLFYVLMVSFFFLLFNTLFSVEEKNGILNKRREKQDEDRFLFAL